MVIMNLRLDNFLVFNDFELCMSYPKKIVRSTIEDECLSGRERFSQGENGLDIKKLSF